MGAKVGLADRLFLAAETPETPQHVASLGTFKIPKRADPGYVGALAARMRAVTTVAQPFNYRLRSWRLRNIAPAWDVLPDDEIDLDYHLRHSALPHPGSERELGVLISRLHSRQLDPGRPLWEFHLIEGLEDNRFAWYFKVHHSLIDGVGGVQRAQQMLSTDPADTTLRPLWSIGPAPRTGGTERGHTDFGQLPRRGVGWVWNRLDTLTALEKAAGAMVVRAVRRSDPDAAVPFTAPRSVLNGAVGRQRRVATQTYDYQRIRALAHAAGVTINDIFLAICAGGLRRYLDELGQLPQTSLTAGTPVNVRLSDDDATGNAFTMIIVKLGTEIADPLERLAAISRSSTSAKNRLFGMPKDAANLYPSLFMGPFIGENLVGLGGHLPPPYNVTISNVPGVVETQYLCGAEMEAMYPLTMLYHGVGLFIALFTGSGRIGVGFTGDRDALPHLQRLAVYTGEALDELETLLSRTDTPSAGSTVAEPAQSRERGSRPRPRPGAPGKPSNVKRH